MNNEKKDFYGLGIAPGILNVLAKLNFTVPTPIQVQAIPIAIEGKDLMGIAQTGTGKTLAFGVPVIQSVLKDNGLGLIIAPTRELAQQIDETLVKVGHSLGIKTALLIGGEPIYKQTRALSRMPNIIIGTPGRIIDHMKHKNVDFKKVRVLVLDEADRMLDMGFAPQLRQILVTLPRERQTMLFSATMPESIVGIARTYLKLPITVEMARSGTAAKDVTQRVFFISQEDKPRLLEKILQEYKGSVLVFSRTKFAAKKIAMMARNFGHSAVEIHSNRSLSQRREAMEGFKKGKYRVMVATDIAARGIDVNNIELVINYDLPENAEDYVHRIGRTGRAGAHGEAISFARPNQKFDVRSIERLTRLTLPISKLPELPPRHAFHSKEEVATERRPFRNNRFNPRQNRGNSSYNYRGRRNRF
jgi:ATP-dependent RNA helicase RhlE